MGPRWIITFVVFVSALHWSICREVALPAGPLYRVAGFPLSIPCTVTGYEGSRTQDFEWYLYREDSEGRQIGVISTRDAGFPYTPYQARVQGGEVRVERDSGDKARLVIQRLRPDDQGRYECYTPSTDTRFQGNYSSSVAIKVIPDTLLITHSRILSGVPVTEGTELQLTCAASVQSEQHTHLSVTFGLRSRQSDSLGHNLREIMTIDRDLRATPGTAGAYTKRYDAGEVALEKRKGDGGRDLYVLKINTLAPEDSGSYFCEAAQWIRDPDGTWERIAQRTMELGNLSVQPLSETLAVRSAPEGLVSLPPGALLTLSCLVSGAGSLSRSAMLVQWTRRRLKGGPEAEVEVARLGSDGVVSWGDVRAGGGSLEKESEGKITLRIFSVHPEDAGRYRCTVSIYAGRRTPDPMSPATITQRSDWVTLSLKRQGLSLSGAGVRRAAPVHPSVVHVALHGSAFPLTVCVLLLSSASLDVCLEVRVSAIIDLPRRPLLKRGSTVTLFCNVSISSSTSSKVEVQWLQIPERRLPSTLLEDNGEEPRVLAALSYDGLLQVFSNGSERSIERLSTQSFRMRIFSAAEEDRGEYQCQAEVWVQDPKGDCCGHAAASSGGGRLVVVVCRHFDHRYGDLLLHEETGEAAIAFTEQKRRKMALCLHWSRVKYWRMTFSETMQNV
ncbi:hypothetical protein DNTS_032009 [Danionella cerebrum]|uniref:Ig-like domain-containing protein n=1 Tax=Danionella cerebrum TaxID=2873325 RepID=A0A553R9Q6_9TELE|nr:hypothetical protein DNTS_032009 [Danionella translucida]